MKIKPRVDKINELLLRKGFTKRSFAKKAELGQVTIVQITNGDRNPSPPVAKKIVDTLEVEFDDIFYIEKSEAVASK